jgi:hypothetical protein
MPAPTDAIRVSVQRSPQSIRLVGPDDVIQVWIDGVDRINQVRNDFAAWYFLPIAMRAGRDLRIEGEGSEETIRNARRMSEIWETWLPHHFTAVNVSFDTVSPRRAVDGHRKRSLCCYSGGLDSTHALLTRHRAGETQDLLTLHGMDYRLEDKEKFEAFKDKIAPFSRLVGDGHIFVSTDAHASYRTRRINKWGHFSHIFVLAGSGFLFSEEYDDILIAADYRIDQQFIAHPWGSNGATNIYFDDGHTRLTTLEGNLSRTEKTAMILTSKEALQSVSFCSVYQWRPNNCGRCQKCMRTKVMFFVATGSVPEIFAEQSIPPSWFKHFDLTKRHQAAFLLDIISCAKRTGRLAQLPNADVVYAKVKQQKPAKVGGKKERRGIGAKLLHFLRRKTGRPAKASRRAPSRTGADT